MTRPAAVGLLILLVLAMVAVPALVVANYVGAQAAVDLRVTQLEQRVDQLTTDVSLMRE
jgi:hypothetical protein